MSVEASTYDSNRDGASQPVQPSSAESSSELCSICCNPIQVVAVGRCDHALTCAICTLRLRTCYRDNACPFCKTHLRTVYLTEKSSVEGPQLRYQTLATRKREFAADKRWPPGIWVDKESRCEGQTLMDYLLSFVKLSCTICDPSGLGDGFESFKELREHLKKTHNGSTVCNVCYQANRYFPRELEIFKDEASFQTHVDSHPRCEYCTHRYFGKDELYNHMRKKHSLCQLCHSQGERHVYFENLVHYGQHLREAHFACNEAECAHSLIAYNTVQELNAHMAQVHGIQTGTTGRRRNMRHVPPHVVGLEVRPAAVRPAQRRGFSGNDVQQRGVDGFYMIDDDLPPAYNAQPVRNEQRPSQPSNQPRRMQDEFPALPTPDAAPRPTIHVPRKVMVRTQCPCGRISRNVSVPENTVPEGLKCDAECERAQRRARLAEAFNIDTSTYSGSFTANFSADLVTWARNDQEHVQHIESQLHDRIRLRDVQRFQLSGLTKEMKKQVVELAETYGAVGRMVGNSNAVEIVLTNRSCLPAQKLFNFANSLTEEQYQDLVRESLKQTLILEEIAKSVNPKRYLISWDGDYEIEFVSKTVARLKFRTPQAFNDACAQLGGGVRNVFKVRNPSREFKHQDSTPQATHQNPTSLRPTSEQNNTFSASTAQRKGDNRGRETVPAEELKIANSFEVLSRL